MTTTPANATRTDKALCPLCQRMFKLNHRSDGADTFPTHGHEAQTLKRFHTTARAPQPKCRVSGWSVGGLKAIGDIIDALAALAAMQK